MRLNTFHAQEEGMSKGGTDRILAIFPCGGKNPGQGESEGRTEWTPGRWRRNGRKEGEKEVKPQGSKVTQYFIHRASPE